jgi:hypothetical protein
VTVVTGPAAVPATGAGQVGRQEVDAFTHRLIGRHGSAESALSHLAGEQLKYRKRARRAEKVVDQLQKRLPTEGSVVLSGEEAKAFNALRTENAKFSLVGLGETLKELSQLRTHSSTRSREETLTTAAGKKYKLAILKMAVGDTPIEFKKVMVRNDDTEDGEPTFTEEQVPYIKVGDTLELLDTWLERERKDFLDIIHAPDEEEESGSKVEKQTKKPTGPSMPKQTGSRQSAGKGGKGSDNIKAVNAALGRSFMTPSQRAKAARGEK